MSNAYKNIMRNIRDKVIDSNIINEGNLEQELMSEEEFEKSVEERENTEENNIIFKESIYTNEKIVCDSNYKPPMNANKGIYIILTKTSTVIGKTINKVMGTEYNHASLAFDKTFNNAYGFARLGKGDSIFKSGFRKEDFSVKGYMGGHYCIMELPVTEEQYNKAIEIVRRFETNKNKYNFDRLGLVLAGLNIPLHDQNKFFCSKFVDYVLKNAGIQLFYKDYALVRPNDFLINSALTKVEEGKIEDKLKKEKLLESKIEEIENLDEETDFFNINKLDESNFNKYILEGKRLNKLLYGYLSTSKYYNDVYKYTIDEDFYNNNNSILKAEEDFNNGKISEYTIFYYGLSDAHLKEYDGQFRDLDLNNSNLTKVLFNHVREINKKIFNTELEYDKIRNFNEFTSLDELSISINADICAKSKKFIKNESSDKIIDNQEFDNIENVLTEAANTKTKREKIEELVYKVVSTLDVSGINVKKYKEFFSKMSDEQFNKYIKKFLKDEDENFYLEILPSKNEPDMKQITKALDILKIPMEEYLYLRHDGHHDDPIRSRTPVPVGYLNVRRLQQILSKKNTYSLDISSRNMKTGQVSGSDKIARISDAETYALTAVGAKYALKEFMGPRADAATSKRDMYKNINLYGYTYLKDLENDITENQTLNTIYTYLLGAGLENDLLKEPENKPDNSEN